MNKKTEDPDGLGMDGGPCGGKTTLMTTLSESLLEKGIIPLIVPEAATLLIQAGVTPETLGSIPFQKEIVRLQLNNEKQWKGMAQALSEKYDKRAVLLHDRGLLTGSAYLFVDNQLEVFQREILNGFHLDVETIRSRYLGIIHMVTAADGALDYYTLANNSARTESAEQAFILDGLTQKAWLGHSHLALIGNRDKAGQPITFEQKINRAVAEAFRILGVPVPIELEDKFKLKSFNPNSLPVPYEKIDIVQNYLIPQTKGTEERVRRRTWNGYSSYFHTIKSPGPNGEGRFEIEKHISPKKYEQMLQKRYPASKQINKTRYCFLWNAQYFEVDVFSTPHSNLLLMERERTDVNDKTELPNFIDVEKDVTGTGLYSNYTLAMA
jgi:CYTH domain-containing protein